MCDLGYLIKDHVGALMQALTDHLRTPYIQVDTTKCLNTAFMTMYLMLGDPAINVSTHCDTHRVRRRLRSGEDKQTRLEAATALAADVMDERGRDKRTLYYVMLTDGDMPRVDGRGGGGTAYFPGHVFVVERLPRGTFNLYQSYVGKYDLAGVIDRHSLSKGRRSMGAIMRGLCAMMQRGVWDARTTRFWRTLTDVDGSAFEGCGFGKDAMLVCYRSAGTLSCVSYLRDFVRGKLASLKQVPRALDSTVYGSRDAYDHDAASKPLLTNAQMRTDLGKLLSKLE